MVFRADSAPFEVMRGGTLPHDRDKIVAGTI